MPPKSKITKEILLRNALQQVREQGAESLNARTLAKQMQCSTQPIFTHYPTMDALKQEILEEAHRIYTKRIKTAMQRTDIPSYKASGLAYIAMAKEEPQLFKLLFMRDRSAETITDAKEEITPFLAILRKNMGLTEEQAYLFHLEMWVTVHGIATMIATSYLPWDEDFISNTLTDLYQGLRLRFQQEGSHVCN